MSASRPPWAEATSRDVPTEALVAPNYLAVIQSAAAALSLLTTSTLGPERELAAGPEAARDDTNVRLEWVDFDRDGLFDVYAVAPRGVDRLYRNAGDGSFVDVTASVGLSGLRDTRALVWLDFNGDGALDLQRVCEPGIVRLYAGTRSGAFVDATSSAGLERFEDTLSASSVDYDFDGRPDLRLTTASGDVLLHNDGQGGFEQVEFGSGLMRPTTRVPRSGEGVEDLEPQATDPGRPTAPGGRSEAAPDEARASSAPLSGTSASVLSGSVSRPITGAATSSIRCYESLIDQAGSGVCIQAASTPTLGMLYPISDKLFIDSNGKVGLGTTLPSMKLSVRDTQDGALAGIAVRNDSAVGGSSAGVFAAVSNGTSGFSLAVNSAVAADSPYNVHLRAHQPGASLLFHSSGASTPGLILNAAGNVGIGTTSPTDKLHVVGSTRTKCLTITGGCDIVEGFETGHETYESGTVLVIDAARPGELTQSSAPYDKRVAGVVSGAGGVQSGIALSQEGTLEGRTAVAMVGRVYVKCSTENGAIEPGDLLTTSGLSGHAMRASDEKRANGAILGKAMTALGVGEGLVLVLVNLQ